MEFKKDQKVYVLRVREDDIVLVPAYVNELNEELIKLSMKKDCEFEAFEVRKEDSDKLFFVSGELAKRVFKALLKKADGKEYSESFYNGLTIDFLPGIYRFGYKNKIDIREGTADIVKMIRADESQQTDLSEISKDEKNAGKKAPALGKK